jgi:hypothetical protein
MHACPSGRRAAPHSIWALAVGGEEGHRLKAVLQKQKAPTRVGAQPYKYSRFYEFVKQNL